MVCNYKAIPRPREETLAMTIARDAFGRFLSSLTTVVFLMNIYPGEPRIGKTVSPSGHRQGDQRKMR